MSTLPSITTPPETLNTVIYLFVRRLTRYKIPLILKTEIRADLKCSAVRRQFPNHWAPSLGLQHGDWREELYKGNLQRKIHN